MATRVDHLADSDSPLASRARELTARFIDDALPYLNQLNDRARRMTRMLRAYAGFNTFSDGTNLRAWVFRVTSQHLHQRSAPHATPRKRVPHRPATPPGTDTIRKGHDRPNSMH